jgi:hypothetical protein
MQWTGRNPGILALRFTVTGTLTACDVTTCSVKISCVKICFILVMLFGRMGTCLSETSEVLTLVNVIVDEFQNKKQSINHMKLSCNE